MLLGYSTWGMPNLPIDSIIDHLAALGFDAVEIAVLPEFSTALELLDGDERRRIAGLLRTSGLALSAVMAYLPMAVPDEESYTRHAAYVCKAMELAVDWTQDGLPPVVITGIGGKPGQLEAILPRLVERLEKLGAQAQAAGVVVALEPHIGTAVETPGDVQRLMSQLESPAVRVNFDISHFNILGIPIEESVSEMLPYSVHAHVKDERGRVPDFDYVIPGEGEFDYVAYLKAMDAHSYDGCISVEISKMVQQRPEYDPLAAATRSYRVVGDAFADAGIKR